MFRLRTFIRLNYSLCYQVANQYSFGDLINANGTRELFEKGLTKDLSRTRRRKLVRLSTIVTSRQQHSDCSNQTAAFRLQHSDCSIQTATFRLQHSDCNIQTAIHIWGRSCSATWHIKTAVSESVAIFVVPICDWCFRTWTRWIRRMLTTASRACLTFSESWRGL